jgi:hypothetical protein
MSWIDKIKNQLIITTGAGDQFKPSWINAKLLQEYNIAEFNFQEVEGTLVKRGKRLGIKFSMEIYFEGPDHLDISEQFRQAAKDQSFWVLEHPLYGVFPCHPTSLDFDNSGYNLTKITGTLIETIIDDQPLIYGPEFSLPEKIEAEKTQLDSVIESTFVYPLSPIDVNTMRNTNNRAFNLSVPIITLPDEFEDYNNLFNQANTAINTAIASPVLAMRAVTSALTQPARFTANVKSRVDVLVNSFDSLHETINGLSTIASKQIYQNQNSTLLASMCLAASTPLENNYTNKNSVLQIIDLIFAKYALFLEDLDLLQSINGGSVLSYVPDPSVLTTLSSLIDTTLAGLFTIALSSRQERSIINETDINIIVLTHRLYGLDQLDKNIDELIANNEFGLDHLIQIPKGKKIIYYI